IFEGFDIVIGNPPYIKEYEKRDAFDGLRDKNCYQGKMDLWYMFGDLGLKLLKPNSYLCFIATNNWVTNTGASNFRNIVISKSQIENLIDFGAYMIFDSASIQTMIMLFRNTSSEDNYRFDYRRLNGEKTSKENVLDLLAGVTTKHTVLLSPTINKKQLKNKPLVFNTDEHSSILEKIKDRQNFTLREKADKKKGLKSEMGQGIVAPQDFVNKDSAEILGGRAKVGDGVFVLSQSEIDALSLQANEWEIIKPYYTTEQLGKYYGNKENTHWLIYTKSNIDLPNPKTGEIQIDSYPTIKRHLDKFTDVITSHYAPYGLHRSREQHLFEGKKIIVLRKCPKEPIFTYTDFDCYVSQTFFVIQSDRINLKYLTGLLNSKLVEFWLRRKGKMQGNSYQLDKEPLL
ncbi:MAG TPA: Eco57I restriction-modification methylase domain-containing protein, partial [Chitinophagales bacterium]|nr:Eco57I restriction-modification methylase domain-containing protein [Chitinophagales bacterium]